jgi:hypothetical protein
MVSMAKISFELKIGTISDIVESSEVCFARAAHGDVLLKQTTNTTGWWFQTFVILHFIYGMSSFPLIFIFFKMGIAPPTMWGIG